MKSSRHLTQVRDLHGPQVLATVRTPPSVTQFLLRGAKLGFGTWKMGFVLAALLAVAPLCPPFLHAGILPTFTAGNVTVGPGGSVGMPITVTSFGNVTGIQLSLTWDSGLLTLRPVLDGGPIDGLNEGLGGGTFGAGTGSLTWVWANDSAPVTVDNGTAIFSVQFIAGSTLGNIPVSFGNTPTAILVALLDGTSGDSTTVTFNNGSVNVTPVPEPINWALGLFACVFVGGAAMRWISNRRLSCSLRKLGDSAV